MPIYNRQDGQYYVLDHDWYIQGQPWEGINEESPGNKALVDKIKFGGMFKLSMGVEIPLFDKLMLSIAYGYQFEEGNGVVSDVDGSEVRHKVSRQTVDVVPFYNIGRHRVGVGAAVHLNPKYVVNRKAPAVEQTSAFNENTDYIFDDAVGYIIQYDYLVTKNTSVGVRYTNISYDLDSITTNFYSTGHVTSGGSCTAGCDDIVRADSVGVHVTYHF